MTEQIIIFFQIVFIDLVLAGDNAIIIGMVASQFQADQRKKIIFWGIGAAVILRIIFTLVAAYLLQINGLRLIGGILLLYIVYKLYIDVIKNFSEKKENIKVDKSSLLKAITTVIIADVTMSLDNVLGVAGAAKDHYVLLMVGLALSIAIMATAANLISKWIKKYKKEGIKGLYEQAGRGRKSVFKDIPKEEIKEIVNKKVQVAKINAEIRDKYGIKVSNEAVRKFIKKNLSLVLAE